MPETYDLDRADWQHGIRAQLAVDAIIRELDLTGEAFLEQRTAADPMTLYTGSGPEPAFTLSAADAELVIAELEARLSFPHSRADTTIPVLLNGTRRQLRAHRHVTVYGYRLALQLR